MDGRTRGMVVLVLAAVAALAVVAAVATVLLAPESTPLLLAGCLGVLVLVLVAEVVVLASGRNGMRGRGAR